MLSSSKHKKEFAAKEKLEIVQSERVVSTGWKGGLGGIPPALQILGEICSNFFKRTPELVVLWAKAHRSVGVFHFIPAT